MKTTVISEIRMVQSKSRWIIAEIKLPNSFELQGGHRTTMMVREAYHDVGVGFVDIQDNDIIYPYSFNNKGFKTEDEAKKYLAKIFKDEVKALYSMLETIKQFTEENPELMV